MGTKSGRFTGRNGHEYCVSLVGATVATSTIDLCAATISMAAGEHKFCGFKSTTAIVDILTDVPLIELYSAGVTDIRLTIEDITDGKVEFDGYVVPFAFDQPYTGKNDSVTVNAVDLLTARKDVKYESGTGDGTDMYAHDIVGNIAHRAGITELVVNLNFNGTEDAMYTDSPLNVKVAQAGFLQDGLGDLDALSAICQFFGYTSCVVGRTLYLYDEHCLVHAPVGKRYNANVYRRNDTGVWTVYRHYYNQGSPIIDQYVDIGTIRNDIGVTIERAYDGIQIQPEGSDTSMLLPDVCADENLEDLVYDDGRSALRTYANDDVVIYRTPRSSKLLVTGRAGNGIDDITNLVGTANSDYMTEGDPNKSTYWSDGSVPMRYSRIEKEPFTLDGNEIKVFRHSDLSNMLWVRLRTVSPSNEPIVACVQRVGMRYSHTGGYARLSCDVVIRSPETSGSYMPPAPGDEDKGAWRMPWLQVRLGDLYLHRVTYAGVAYEWGSGAPSPLVKGEDGKVVPSTDAIEHYDEGYIFYVPTDAPLYVEIAKWHEQGVRDYFFKMLSLEGVGDAIDLDHPDMLHGDKGGELLEVSTVLTTRSSGRTSDVDADGHRPYGVNARPSVVLSDVWKGGYMGRADSEGIPISGILMEQLKARYAQPRICYKMTVEKDINPCAAVYYGGNGYTVEAYDKDLYNSTTNITID